MAADRTKYNFRNLKNLPKNRLVLEVVRKFIDDNRGHLIIDELKNTFDKNIFSHSLDIVMDESGRQQFEQTRQEGEFETRYFHGKDTLKLNNENIYVTSEWGRDTKNRGRFFYAFLAFAKNELGYSISEATKGIPPIIGPAPAPHSQNIVKNIILYGVPGVGKTYNVDKLIQLIDEGRSSDEIFSEIRINEKSGEELSEELKERTEFITFHQSFGYEDFIEGFRPDENGQIRLQSGIFKRICERARENKEQNYYLVIDEINRGNISKIFGELITLIEEDKRDTLEVTLPYSKKPFRVPSNLYIIGTMNSTDKSIALIDVALRRRFTFVKMEPNADLIDDPNAKKLFIALNDYLRERLGEDYQIGHSYFMKVQSDGNLDFVNEYKIKPLLEEYFYGDNEGLNRALKILEEVDSEEPKNDE